MSSYRAQQTRTPSLSFWLVALWLAFSPPAQAASSVALGAGNSASARIDFRIVIPGRLHLSVARSAGGAAVLNASVYSLKGQIAVGSSVDQGQSGVATLGQSGVVKTTDIAATSGIYTIASP